jgi:tRNA threonylcarbamoyladenosine biosynthesis protein TsaB
VYAGFYRARGAGIVALADEVAVPPAALADRIRAVAGAAAPAAFGEGYDAYAAVLGPAVPRLATEVKTPPAEAMAALVAERLAGATFDAQALFALEPHYVRKSEAEVKFPHGTVPGTRSS